MYLLTLLIGAVIAFLAVGSLLRRVRPPAMVRVLGAGRWHYLVLGVLAGLGLRLDGSAASYLPQTARELVGVALVWVGFEVGLGFDLRRLRQIPLRRTGAEAAHALIAVLLTAGVSYLLLPTMANPIGFVNPSGLALLALGGFVASVRMPELLVVWRGGTVWLPPDGPFSLSAVANPAVLIAYGLAFPVLAAPPALTLGRFEAVGYTGWLVAILGAGLLLGVCTDFLFRAHSKGAWCIFLSMAAVISVAGTCLHAGLPGLAAGFIGGAWLVNATVGRREVLELSERVGAVLEPLLFFLSGCLLAVDVGLDLRVSVVALAFGLFAFRGLIRTLSAWIAWPTTKRSSRLPDLLGLGWRPAGTVAVSILVQSLILVPGDALSRLVAPALFSVFLTQLIPSPAFRKPRAAGPPSRQTAPAAS